MDTLKKRQEEATSSETLEDLEALENEESLTTDNTDDTDGLSPDGAFDEPGELTEADPL